VRFFFIHLKTRNHRHISICESNLGNKERSSTARDIRMMISTAFEALFRPILTDILRENSLPIVTSAATSRFNAYQAL